MAWLVLLLYPVVMGLIADPSVFRLGRERKPGIAGFLSYHKMLKNRLEERGRWLLAGKLLLAATLLLVWAKRYGFGAAALGFSSHPVGAGVATGFIAGAFLICGRFAFHGFVERLPRASKDVSRFNQSRGPVLLWLLILVLSAAFEEPWRAFSLLACREADWSQLGAIALISFLFTFAQHNPIPARAPTENWEELWTFALAVLLAVLFLKFGTVLVPFVASLTYNTTTLALVRRAAASS